MTLTLTDEVTRLQAKFRQRHTKQILILASKMAKRGLLVLLLLLFACDGVQGGIFDDVLDFFTGNLGGCSGN